jgi:malonate decarboxylase delta subunit
MENLRYEYPAATRSVAQRAHVGVVGSGDLEVLLSPAAGASAEVVIRTSVDGYEHVWKSVLDRFFQRYDGAVKLELNDFGATPGVVMLRLAEAVEVSEKASAGDAA